MSTFGGASASTVPASERELQLLAEVSKLKAELDAMTIAKETKDAAADAQRDEMYKRMNAELWDKPILQPQELFQIQYHTQLDTCPHTYNANLHPLYT